MKFDTEHEATAEPVVIPTDREGETVHGHAAKAGKSVRGDARRRPSRHAVDTASLSKLGLRLKGTGSDVASCSEVTTEVIRASAKLRVDPMSLLNKEQREAHRKRKCGGAEKCPACHMREVFWEVREQCVRAANTSVRVRWAIDGAVVDRVRIAEQRNPTAKDWKEWELGDAIRRVCGHLTAAEILLFEQKCDHKSEGDKRSLYLYPLLTRVAPGVAPGIITSLDKMVLDKWRGSNGVRWKALVTNQAAPPHYNRTLPIPIRRQDLKFRKTEWGYEVAFSLRPQHMRERGASEFTVPLVPKDAYQRDLLGWLAEDPSTRLAEAKLLEDSKRRGQWYLRLAYKRKVVQQPRTTRVAAINRGIINFLWMVTSSGKRWVYDGADIEAGLKRVQRQRIQRQSAVRASARIGHGRTKTLQPIQVLRRKGEMWRSSKCQTIARRVSEWLQGHEVSVLYMEDFSGIRRQAPEALKGGEAVWQRIQEWPYDQLGRRIRSCCEEIGIQVVERTAVDITACPECDERENVVVKRDERRRHYTLSCRSCKWHGPLDEAQSVSLMRAGESEHRGSLAQKTGKSPKKRGSEKISKATARKAAAKSLKTKERSRAARKRK